MRWHSLLAGSLFASSVAAAATGHGGGGGDGGGGGGHVLPYKNPALSPEARAADLLGRMTIEDKTAQLMQGDISTWLNPTTGAFNYSALAASMTIKAGMFYVGYDISFEWLTENVKRAQDFLLYNTTLGIPALVQTEGIHGFLLRNATIFNSPIGYGASWNRDLVRQMAEVIGVEARALGVTQLFAPMVDPIREQRYGRVEESTSEDPYLAGELAYEYVVGLQSQNVSAMVKQFAAFSEPEQGLNTGPVRGGERLLRTSWLPPYKRAIIDGGAWSIMGAYSSYDGIPSVADHHLLTDILRNEWGYKYFVMSDAGGTDRLCWAFHTCVSSPIDKESVTLQALPAGTDVEMGGGSFNYQTIPQLVKAGKLSQKDVDTAVTRLLVAKFAMGLFENPYPAVAANEWPKRINTAAHKQVARQLDTESIVLLENHGGTLPLQKKGSIAVIGPFASGIMNYGDYVVYNSKYRGVTPLAGVQGAVGKAATVRYAEGCKPWSNDQSGFAEAVDAASKSDVAIVVVGTWSRDQGQLWTGINATTGEHVDVDSLALVGAQGALVQAIQNTGVPTVVVLSSGKPITDVKWLAGSSAALVQQFYPSEEGGNALADVLFGDATPSGRLPLGFARSVGDLPIAYDFLASGRPSNPDAGYEAADGTLVFGHQYVLGSPAPFYAFGYGLGYANVSYSNVRVDKTKASASSTVTVSVDLTNTHATRSATEVVQVYVSDQLSTVEVPNKQLKGFTKVTIAPGKTVTASVPLAVADWGLWNARMQYVVEAGAFSVQVARSALDVAGTVTVTVG